MSCAPEPAVPPRPAPGVARPEDKKATFIDDLRDAGADCRDTVGSIAQRRALYAAQYEKENFNGAEKLWRKLTGKTEK